MKSLAIRHHIINEYEAKSPVQHQILMIYRIALEKYQRDLQLLEQVTTEQPEFGKLMTRLTGKPQIRFEATMIKNLSRTQDKFENRKEAERLSISRRWLSGCLRRYREGRVALEDLLTVLGGACRR